MLYTDEDLIERVESHADNFSGWHKGMYDIWVRSKEDIPDAFNDKVYTFKSNGKDKPTFLKVCTGTSHAGTYGLLKFWKWNPKGCAVLKANHIEYNCHRYGWHKGYRAYRQVKPFPYFRDNDKDLKAEEIGKIYNDIILANSHRAKKWGISWVIYNWSVACLVRNKSKEWFEWLEIMNKQPLSVAILKEFQSATYK